MPSKCVKKPPRPKPPLRSIEERNALVVKNIGLVYRMVRRSRGLPVVAVDFEEAIGRGTEALIRAAELWDEERAAFSTYATRAIWSALCNSTKQDLWEWKWCEFPLNEDGEQYEFVPDHRGTRPAVHELPQEWENKAIRLAWSRLTIREQSLIRMWLLGTLPQRYEGEPGDRHRPENKTFRRFRSAHRKLKLMARALEEES